MVAVGPSGVHPCLGARITLQHPRPSSLHCRCRMAEDRPHATEPCPRPSGQAHGQQACPELRLTGKRPLCRRFVQTTRGPTRDDGVRAAASARQGLTCRRPAAERCATAARAARRSSARGAPSAAGPRTPRRGSPRGGLAFSSRRGVRPGSSRVHLRTRAVACRMRSTNNEPEGRAACTHGAARACQAAGSEVGVAQGSASAPERHETGRPAHCSRRAAYGGRGGRGVRRGRGTPAASSSEGAESSSLRSRR